VVERDYRQSLLSPSANCASNDQRTGYDRTGGAWQRTKRIDEIAVTYDDGTAHSVATYALTYASMAAPNGTGRSRLTEVSVCRGSECLPETLFTTQNGDSGWGAAQATGSSAGTHPIAGDWNGDGRTDLFVSLSNHWQVHPGKADGLFDTTVDTGLSSTTNPDKARVFDYNGDGLADLLYQDGSSNWKVAPSNGTTGFGTSIDTGVATASFPIPILQDHDGDGLADWIYVGGASVGWLRNLGNGSFASAATLYTATGAVHTYSVPTVDAALRSLDANGDGRADLIVQFTDRVYNPNDPGDFTDVFGYDALDRLQVSCRG
jgi:hypothetical protein